MKHVHNPFAATWGDGVLYANRPFGASADDLLTFTCGCKASQMTPEEADAAIKRWNEENYEIKVRAEDVQ